MKVQDFLNAKRHSRKLTMLTAYDAPTAELLENAGVDIILVGDSLGMVVLGYPSTVFVTMDEMIHHAKAVRRGAKHAFIVGDIPLEGVKKGPKQALVSARRFMEEAGCDAVKLEWNENGVKMVDGLRRHRIPVMGHIGLTPQTAKNKDAFRVQGRDAQSALEILETAKTLERHGVFSLLVECVPSPVAKVVTRSVHVPTIGIGAGVDCDGQVLVFHDLAGIFTKFTPRFVKQYARTHEELNKAIRKYIKEVRTGQFPDDKHSFHMKPNERRKFESLL